MFALPLRCRPQWPSDLLPQDAPISYHSQKIFLGFPACSIAKITSFTFSNQSQAFQISLTFKHQHENYFEDGGSIEHIYQKERAAHNLNHLAVEILLPLPSLHSNKCWLWWWWALVRLWRWWCCWVGGWSNNGS